jgi:subtilase family serine protease
MQAYHHSSISKRLLSVVGIAFVLLGLVAIHNSTKVSAAACVAPATDYGTVTQTVTIDSAGTYRLWSRMKAASTDANANSYLLEIDGNTCFTVGDDNSITASAWKWVDYQNGNTTSKIDHTFTAGTHTIKMIGREAGVQLDRLLFLSTTDDCITNSSTDNGDACTVGSNAPPTVSVTAPANNASYTAPASITINASASDSDGIQKVEFYQGSTKLGEDLASPYSYNWTGVAAGTYSITAKAFDNGSPQTSTTSSAISVTVSAAPANQADLIVTAVTASPANPAAGQAVTFSVTIRNQGTAATNEGPGVLFSVNGQPTTWVAHTSSGVFAAGETRTLTANGGVNNVSTWTPSATGAYTVQAHVDDLNRISESNDSNNTLSITLNVGTTTTLAEDINKDGCVNALDFLTFKSKFGQSGSNLGGADINGDGTVNALDFLRFKGAYGTGPNC